MLILNHSHSRFLYWNDIYLSWGIVSDHSITQHMGCIILLHFFVFSLLCCKYIMWYLFEYANSNGLCKFNNIFTRLQKTFSNYEAKEECPHAGLYIYNGRQIELFHVKWFVDRLTVSRMMFLWNTWELLVYRLSSKNNHCSLIQWIKKNRHTLSYWIMSWNNRTGGDSIAKYNNRVLDTGAGVKL